MHPNISITLQIKAEMLSERLDGRFGRVVRRVSGRVGDALLGAGDYDGGGGGGGGRLHEGQQGRDAVDDAKEVGGEDSLEGGGVRPRGGGADSRVEGEEVCFP